MLSQKTTTLNCSSRAKTLTKPTSRPRLARSESEGGPERRKAKTATRFKLRRASFKGQGLQPQFRAASWKDVRDQSYGIAVHRVLGCGLARPALFILY